MKIYNYDGDTKELISISAADIDPLESAAIKKKVFLVPSNATKIAPPALADNEIAIYNEGAKKWVVAPDFRGVRYWSDNNNGVVIDAIGDSPPVGTTTTPPPKPESILDAGKWRDKNNSEISLEKDNVAQEISNQLVVQSIVEEFTDILSSAGVSVPADVMSNVRNRIRGKL